MGKLAGVLIGCGAIAREHLSALGQLDTVEVAAVCDISAAKAEATAERFDIPKWYQNYQNMLADIRPDLVHITTPPSSHFPIARSCLAAGLNVLCEKPITTSYSEFRELKQLATENKRLLMENQSYRFHSSVQRINHLVSCGEFGDILEVQICISLNLFGKRNPYIDRNAPHFSLTLRGGVIGDFLPHIDYLARMFTGPIIDARTTWTQRTRDSPFTADEFRGFIRGERATAFASFSGNGQPDGFLVRVCGTKMRVEANLFEPPRITAKRFRPGEPAVMSLVDGIM